MDLVLFLDIHLDCILIPLITSYHVFHYILEFWVKSQKFSFSESFGKLVCSIYFSCEKSSINPFSWNNLVDLSLAGYVNRWKPITSHSSALHPSFAQWSTCQWRHELPATAIVYSSHHYNNNSSNTTHTSTPGYRPNEIKSHSEIKYIHANRD